MVDHLMADAPSKTVLIADDDEDVRLVLGLPLEAAHYRIVEASTGPEAVALAKRERFDLIVMDWNMPGMTGAELLRTLHEDVALKGVPIIVLTGQTSQSDVAQGRALGAYAYLIKPVPIRQFLDTVRAALGA
jgi:CheY-like chemotaxis protein